MWLLIEVLKKSDFLCDLSDGKLANSCILFLGFAIIFYWLDLTCILTLTMSFLFTYDSDLSRTQTTDMLFWVYLMIHVDQIDQSVSGWNTLSVMKLILMWTNYPMRTQLLAESCQGIRLSVDRETFVASWVMVNGQTHAFYFYVLQEPSFEMIGYAICQWECCATTL